MKQEITTSGGTYVVTFTQAGTVEADRNNRTYILATASEAGQVAFKAISDSVIISDDNAILTAEDFVFAPGPILKPTSGGDSSAGAVMAISSDGETLTYNLTDSFIRIPRYSVPPGVKRITGSIGAAKIGRDAFNSSEDLEICDIDLSSTEDLIQTFRYAKKLKQINSEITNPSNCQSFCSYTAMTEWTKDFPQATNLAEAFYNAKLTRWKSHCPKATNISLIFYECPLADFDIDFPLISTFDFVANSAKNLGLPQHLTNVTAPEGGLAACTSFLLSNKHTALTDASIQNIVDALPDWTGHETTALAQFPAGRLTTAQQSALSAKGWTWSEATD